MAYPAPPTPAAGAIPITTPILTYLQKYRGQGDALEGRYQRFLAPYAPDSGRTHAQLEARILSTMAEVPKVFLGLVEHAGATSSVTLHRPPQYASHPVDASIWDGATLAFAGDVLAGNHIEIVRVPTTALEVAPDNNVLTIAGLQAMLASQPNAVQFGPFDDGAPDTQPMAVRNMVPIPPSYVHLVLDRALNKRALWEQVGGGRHQRWPRVGVQGVAELAALRAHSTKGPWWYGDGITTGIIAWGNWRGSPHATRRCTTPKSPVEHTTPGPASAGPDTLGPD